MEERIHPDNRMARKSLRSETGYQNETNMTHTKQIQQQYGQGRGTYPKHHRWEGIVEGGGVIQEGGQSAFAQ